MELIYTHDGEQIRTYDWAGEEIAWDAVTGERLDEYDGARIIWDVELAADGQLAAMACSDVYVYRLQESNEDVHWLDSEAEEMNGVAFNPDGSILATTNASGAAKLWDMETGQELMTLAESKQPLSGVDFSPDGRQIVTAGADGSVNTYVTSIEDLMDLVRSRLSRDFTVYECRDYLHLSNCPVREE